MDSRLESICTQLLIVVVVAVVVVVVVAFADVAGSSSSTEDDEDSLMCANAKILPRMCTHRWHEICFNFRPIARKLCMKTIRSNCFFAETKKQWPRRMNYVVESAVKERRHWECAFQIPVL